MGCPGLDFAMLSPRSVVMQGKGQVSAPKVCSISYLFAFLVFEWQLVHPGSSERFWTSQSLDKKKSPGWRSTVGNPTRGQQKPYVCRWLGATGVGKAPWEGAGRWEWASLQGCLSQHWSSALLSQLRRAGSVQCRS